MTHPDPSITAFLSFLQFEKRYSRHTLVSYGSDLDSFFQYLETQYEEKHPAKVSPIHIRSWLASMKDAGVSSRSLNRKLSSLKSFYKYCVRNGLVESSPLTRIVSPKNEKRLPAFVTETGMEQLFRSIVFPESWQGKTDRLVLSIFYNTGLRLSELISLKDESVEASRSMLRVWGKGSKERLVPLSAELLELLHAYQKEKKELGLNGKMLLCDEAGAELKPRKVYSMVKGYLGQVTTIDKKSPHVLRHSFATHLANNGADLNAIKELLGHSSLAATQVYTHNTIEKLKNVHRNAHPRS
jgi:integrase/recombinase XerC